jgi:hypothetical protein
MHACSIHAAGAGAQERRTGEKKEGRGESGRAGERESVMLLHLAASAFILPTHLPPVIIRSSDHQISD